MLEWLLSHLNGIKASASNLSGDFLPKVGRMLVSAVTSRLTNEAKKRLSQLFGQLIEANSEPRQKTENDDYSEICDAIEELRRSIGDKESSIPFCRVLHISERMSHTEWKVIQRRSGTGNDYDSVMSDAIRMSLFLFSESVSSDEQVDELLDELDECLLKYRMSESKDAENAGLAIARKIMICGQAESVRRLYLLMKKECQQTVDTLKKVKNSQVPDNDPEKTAVLSATVMENHQTEALVIELGNKLVELEKNAVIARNAARHAVNNLSINHAN